MGAFTKHMCVAGGGGWGVANSFPSTEAQFLSGSGSGPSPDSCLCPALLLEARTTLQYDGSSACCFQHAQEGLSVAWGRGGG